MLFHLLFHVRWNGLEAEDAAAPAYANTGYFIQTTIRVVSAICKEVYHSIASVFKAGLESVSRSGLV
jgi:hypothetical protein